ncbi:uncharacterized protein LOC123968023 [Micropterus dolomieu]|uniref:uncharacterized protein LOC123968023 n=1 Tax=Micropterus dolomieu TaxID=147949 RepID=UPI001E8D7EB7|nr:uncharacterized protein LOC123968023 [Micropterus dolomieu]
MLSVCAGVKYKGVTVISVAADCKSMFPLLCQILKALFYSPERSVYQGVLQTSVTTALGTIQIMAGLFNIGLGPGRTSTNPGDLTSLGAAYWLGAVFIVTGIMSILAGQFPSPCLVGFTVFMNIAGAIFAITGIVLYAIDLGDASLLWMCDSRRNSTDHYGDNCRNVALFAQNLLTSMDVTLIALAVLQLCVNIRLAILGIRALTSEMKKEQDVEDQLPQMKEVILSSTDMSITVVKDKGVTVVTVADDGQSMFPPLCQILKALCCSPMCCSVYKGLLQSNVVSALGTIQIMVGLFNIGLGPGRTSTAFKDFYLGAAYWLGVVFIAAGIMSVLAGRYSSLCLVGFAVFVNIVGSISAIVGVVLYAIDLGDVSVTNMCDGSRYNADDCRLVAYLAQRLLTAMDITLIVLAVLQLCVCISFAVLGIKALVNRKTEEDGRDVELTQPVLKEVLA